MAPFLIVICPWIPAKYTDVNTTISSQATAIVTRSTNLHDMQIYGVIITALLGLAVFGGAKIIARLGPGFLIPVMVSLLFIYVGIISAPRGEMSRERPTSTPRWQHSSRVKIGESQLEIYRKERKFD